MKTGRLLLAAGTVAGLVLVGILLAGETTRAIGIVVPVFLLLLLLALLANPVVFVLLYVALRPLVESAVFMSVGQFSLGVAWGAGLMVVLTIYWLVQGIRQPVRDVRWLIPIAFVIAYALLTLTRQGDTLAALSNWIKLASWVLLALTCEQIAATAEGQRLIVRAGTLMAVLTVAVIALAAAQNQYGTAFYSSDVVYTTAVQGPHGLASLAVVASTFVWMGAMHSRRRGVYVALAGLLALGVALSFVRTTFLAFAVVTVWFLLWALRSKRASAVIAALVAALAVAGAVYVFQDMILTRLADLSGGAAFAAGSGRIGIWQTLWNSATATPQTLLIGQGANASLRAFAAAVGIEKWAHNDFLEFLITGGAGLALLHLLTLGWLLVPGFRLSRDERQSKSAREVGSLVAVLGLAYLVMAFFNGMAFAVSASLAMAMVAGLARGMCSTPGATFLDSSPVEGSTVALNRPESGVRLR